MARTVIPTNFHDDELAEEMQGRRRYRQILNLDGTVSFEDETDYDTEGSTFGASRVNEMAQNINESADVNKIIDDLEDIAVVTQNGFMAGALAVKELNSNFAFDSDGIYGYIRKVDGADTIFPFSGGGLTDDAELVINYPFNWWAGGSNRSYTPTEDGKYLLFALGITMGSGNYIPHNYSISGADVGTSFISGVNTNTLFIIANLEGHANQPINVIVTSTASSPYETTGIMLIKL